MVEKKLTVADLRKAKDLLDTQSVDLPQKHQGPHLIDRQVQGCIICGKFFAMDDTTEITAEEAARLKGFIR